jgi:hypothetical protein
MRVDLLEQKIPVDQSSLDEGGPFGKKFRWTCHQVEGRLQTSLLNITISPIWFAFSYYITFF